MLDIYEIGLEFYNQGDYESAIKIFYLLTVIDPEIPAYWYVLGLAEHQEKNYEIAIIAYRFTFLLKFDAMDALTNACLCFNSLGKVDEKVQFLNEMTELINLVEDIDLTKNIKLKISELQKI